MGSFKFKLVAAFLALSLLPLAAAYWSFSALADRSIMSSVDARLEAGLRAAVAAYEDEREAAEIAAREFAAEPRFQRALAAPDRTRLAELFERHPRLRLELPGGATIGRTPAPAGEARVSLLGPGVRGATLVSAIPLDGALAARLRMRSGLSAPDTLALVDRAGVALVGPGATLDGRLHAVTGHTTTIAGADGSYRAVGVPLAPTDVLLAAVTPISAIDAEQASIRNRLLAALAGSLLLIGLVAYVAGRSIVGALGRLAEAANSIAAGRLRERIPVRGRDEFAAVSRAFNRMAAQLEERVEDLEAERRRLREANARFGEALAATLDTDELRRVIVESAVEATNAGGGLLVGEDGSVVSAGDPETGPERLEFPLNAGRGTFGTLVLLGPKFDKDARITAASLAGQAVVALENARLHRIVERQALVDGLTGLANRRQAEKTLRAELARAQRFGDPVALILADLDDFKAINDEHGHPTGDAVLREVAAAFLETLREVDVAARWGGEEFAVVLPGTGPEGAVQTAERLRRAVEARRPVSADGVQLHVTASFGVAASAAAISLDELVEAADDALYRAKGGGKNRVDTTAHPLVQP